MQLESKLESVKIWTNRSDFNQNQKSVLASKTLIGASLVLELDVNFLINFHT